MVHKATRKKPTAGRSLVLACLFKETNRATLCNLGTCQKEEIGLRSCWLGCDFPCLERLQYLYNRNARQQTPSSKRAKSTYSAVCASSVPSISPKKGTSDFTGLAVGSASRKRQWRLRL